MKSRDDRQEGLFFSSTDRITEKKTHISRDKYEGAMLFSAVGDALGWPLENVSHKAKPYMQRKLPIKSFVNWRKVIGGRYWGYLEEIPAGTYSDDTQLSIAVARCINQNGVFRADRFAYEELPLWLHYERGGGRATKLAARNIVKVKKSDWLHNYFKGGETSYFNAGGNGAAMRNLPIALAKAHNVKAVIIESMKNAVITHGHPRGIVGSIAYGLALKHVLLSSESDARKNLVDSLVSELEISYETILNDKDTHTWIKDWNKNKPKQSQAFEVVYQETIKEAKTYLTAIPNFSERDSRAFYAYVGALSRTTKGSGVATVIAALFTFVKSGANPAGAIVEAANMLDSDTDTVAGFVGGLLGATYGTAAVPSHLANDVQDREYLLLLAQQLHDLNFRDNKRSKIAEIDIDADFKKSKVESYLQILAWEIGLHEMFWDALDEDDTINHPTLGQGIIRKKEVRNIEKEGYILKLIRVAFASGQTCTFRSRVKENSPIDESLSRRAAENFELL